MPSSPPSLLPDVSNLPDGRSNKYTQSSSWWLPSLEIATVPTHENASITPVTSQQTTSTSTQPASTERRFKVLLADDNFDMREYVARLLSERYDVTTVPNGAEALKHVKEQPVDLVLTDVMMPLMDGFSLLKVLRSMNETRMIPVILLSARAGEESKVEGLEAGADDYLIKPFTARELLARVGSHLDMVRMRTDAARREQELRLQVNDAKERLERIISSIQDAFISLDSDLRYAYVNDNAALIAGACKEDMLGMDVWDFMVDTEDKVVLNHLQRAIREQDDVSFECFYPAKDTWYEHRIYPSADGGVSIFTLDITARKKSEERLSILASVGQLLSSSIDCHLPSLLSSILKMGEGSVVADWCVLDIVEERHSLVRLATPQAQQEMWNIVKLPWEQRIDPKKYYIVTELCNGDRVGVECRLSSEEYSFIAFPLAARGQVFGFWLFARSKSPARPYLDEDKAVCEELARRAALAIDNVRLYQEAESANQAKDHFLAALSHELRTPLTPALLLSEALLSETLPPLITENIKTIHESVELEVQLIDDLLDLTKIARGKLQLHTKEVSAHELIGRTLQIVAHDIDKKKLDVTVDPQAPGDRLIADPARLQQVFWNIIKNAIKFTPEHGSIIIRTSNFEIEETDSSLQSTTATESMETGKDMNAPTHPESPIFEPHVMVKSAKGKPQRRLTTKRRVMLRVEVQDTGIGIDASTLPHLFHAFEQGDASITLRFGGLGLGLAISRSLVEMHNGMLSAQSEGKGKGATFEVVLPTIYTTMPMISSLSQDELLKKGTHDCVSLPNLSGNIQSAITRAAMSPTFPLGTLALSRRRRKHDSAPPDAYLIEKSLRRVKCLPTATSSTTREQMSDQHCSATSSDSLPTSKLDYSVETQATTSEPEDEPSISFQSSVVAGPNTAVSSSVLQPLVSPLRPAAPIRPLKVLLIEDNKSTLLIMSRLLQQRLGYQVLVASSVKEAIEVAEREEGKFDLVISDIGLPDGTGLQLMTILRAKYQLKGIALSGYGMEEDVKRSKNAGFEVHLTKPVNFSSLTAAINRVVPPVSVLPPPSIAPPVATFMPHGLACASSAVPALSQSGSHTEDSRLPSLDDAPE